VAAGIAGSAALVLVEGVVPLRPEPALFEAMLEGWRRQQAARRLSTGVVDGRERVMRRFREFAGVSASSATAGPIAGDVVLVDGLGLGCLGVDAQRLKGGAGVRSLARLSTLVDSAGEFVGGL
jgi:hypothetical protein